MSAPAAPSAPSAPPPTLALPTPAPGKGQPGFVDRSLLPGGYALAASYVIRFTSVDDNPAQVVRTAQLQELAQLQEQLDALQHERARLGPAIALMVFGLGGTAVGALGAIAAHDSAQHAHDAQHYRNLSYGFGGLAAVGLVMGLAGSVKLGHASAQRRANDAKAQKLAQQMAALRNELSLGVNLGAQQLQIGLQGTF